MAAGDSLILNMMSLSFIKFTFFWIPSLSMIVSSLTKYWKSTVKRLLLYSLSVLVAYALYIYVINAYVAYDFRFFFYSLLRTMLLFINGPLFNTNLVYLSNETEEYIYDREEWFITLLSVGFLHFFGKYVIMNILVAFLKKDFSDTQIEF